MELCAGSFAQNRIIKRSIALTARGKEYPGSGFQGRGPHGRHREGTGCPVLFNRKRFNVNLLLKV